jgi:predicted RecA/RadA family phage recombinase
MAKNWVQPGDVVTVAAPYDVLSGGGCLVGNLFGVAAYDALEGAEVELNMTGVFDLAKVSAQAWTVGAIIYWDDDEGHCTTTASTNKAIGLAVADAADPSATGRVRLNMGPQGIQGIQGETGPGGG